MNGAELTGRVAVVTGASRGIGKEIARGLARGGATVVLACRNHERGQAALEELVADTGNDQIELMLVDVANQDSIRGFAATLRETHPRVHVLVNNAGIWSRTRQLSSEGIELTWATNVLGYFLVTELLADLLEAAAPARIINLCSRIAFGLRLGDVEMAQRRFNGFLAYAHSKQADVMLTWAWAQRLASSGVSAHAVYPGRVATEIDREQHGLFVSLLRFSQRFSAVTPAEGADTAIWLASTPEIDGQTGKAWMWRREQRRRFNDPGQVEALWALCHAMTIPSAPQGARGEAAVDGG